MIKLDADVPDPAQLIGMAAVRRSFHPEQLLDQWMARFPDALPEQQRQATEAVFDLEDMAVPMEDEHGSAALTLPDERRMDILAGLGSDEAQRLLAAIPPEEVTIAERMLGDVLASGTLSLPDKTLDDDYVELATMRSVSRWAEALGVPAAAAHEEAGQRLRRLDFLKALGGADLPRFLGRQHILDDLHHAWFFRRFPGECNVVTLEGPGGIGKSLTVTRFIADLLNDGGSERPDAVYHLDFDRLNLQQVNPDGIWRELLRQSTAWCRPEAVDTLEELAQTVAGKRAYVPDAAQISRGPRRGRDMQFDDRLCHTLLDTIRRDQHPRLLIFVDSFEQVLGRDDVASDSPFDVAMRLARLGASVLLVVASRTFTHFTPPEQLRHRIHTLTLEEFSVAEAVHYLRDVAGRNNIAIGDWEAVAITEVVGRSPLALRLAAALLEKGERIDNATAWRARAASAPELIQATLYERLLRRIRHPELRKLAVPGLLVRRLNADVIREVLAAPCHLDLERYSPATLIEAAKAEGQLFSERPDDPGAVWHRPDVRATMLANWRRLAPDAPDGRHPPAWLAHLRKLASRERATAIHERAVAYYAVHGQDLIGRTEELYHRLCLDQAPGQLDPRWTPAALGALQACLDELPDGAQRYVRAKMGAATVRDRPAQATPATADAEFDLLVRKRLLSSGRSEELADAWNRSDGSLDGPMGALFAAALVEAGHHEEMLYRASRLLGTPSMQQHAQAAAGVMRIAAAVLEGRGLLDQAEIYWQRAVTVARTAPGQQSVDELDELAGLVGLLRVTRKLGKYAVAQADEARRRALDLLKRHRRKVARQGVLAREACAELGWPVTIGADIPQAVWTLLYDVIESNEAFPSAAGNDARMEELSALILGIKGNLSLRNLIAAALRILQGGADKVGMLFGILAEEVDLTLARAAWPAGSAAQEVQLARERLASRTAAPPDTSP